MTGKWRKKEKKVEKSGKYHLGISLDENRKLRAVFTPYGSDRTT